MFPSTPLTIEVTVNTALVQQERKKAQKKISNVTSSKCSSSVSYLESAEAETVKQRQSNQTT